MKDEAAKCQKVGQELEEITKQKMTENNEVTAYSLQANRQLMQKLMEQREILSNRQEFLKEEQLAVTREINKSKAKTDILEKKKLRERAKFVTEKGLKLDDRYNQINKR